MHNIIAENLLNFTGTSNLYCAWVLVQDGGRDRLAAIWIDRESGVTGVSWEIIAEHE